MITLSSKGRNQVLKNKLLPSQREKTKSSKQNNFFLKKKKPSPQKQDYLYLKKEVTFSAKLYYL